VFAIHVGLIALISSLPPAQADEQVEGAEGSAPPERGARAIRPAVS
jgi:hypothetical protein